jgi:dTDP-glucose pyrophosphorylase
MIRQAVILAGGLGKRMGEVGKQIPKVLLKYEGKTLLERNIEKLKQLGIENIAVVIGHKGELIKELLGSSVKYYQQRKQMGTADAVAAARDFITDTYFLVMNGDILVDDSLEDLIKMKPPVIASYKIDDTSRFGKLLIKGGKLVEIKEKTDDKGSGLINAGIYIFPKGIFQLIEKTPLSTRGEYEITDSISMLIKSGVDLKVYPIRGKWKDVASPDNLQEN